MYIRLFKHPKQWPWQQWCAFIFMAPFFVYIIAGAVSAIIKYFSLPAQLASLRHSSGSAAIERQIRKYKDSYIQRKLQLAKSNKSLRFESIESYHSWLAKNSCKEIQVLTIADSQHVTKRLKSADILSKHSCRLSVTLQQLRLHGLGLETMETFSIQQLAALQVLSLQWNNLRILNAGEIQPLKNLQALDLRHNQLEFVDMNFLNKLSLLDVSHNPVTSIKNLEIGANSRGAIFSFKNTTLESIDFCYTHLPRIRETTYAKIYVGVGHTIKCTCPFLALQDYIIGNGCIRMSVEATECVRETPNDWLCSKMPTRRDKLIN